MIPALLLIYAVGVLGTALELCRREDDGFLARLELMALWPSWLAVRLIV